MIRNWLTISELVEIQKQRVRLIKVEKPKSERKDRAIVVLKIIEGLWLTRAGIKGFEILNRRKQE